MSKAILIAVVLLTLVVVPGLFADPVIDLQEIRQAIADRGAKWTAEINPVWNLSSEQRKARLGWDRSLEDRNLGDPSPMGRLLDPPTQFDWRDVSGESYITPIRDQAQCGSCAAFGAMTCVEARFAIDAGISNPLLNLSEQFLLSCGGGSCSGYSLSNTCQFLRQTGSPTESCMPYQADDTIPCNEQCPDSDMERLRIASWGWIPGGLDGIKERILDGPVYVAFDVYADFNAYEGGIYEHVWGEYEGGHAVAFVGWNDDESYWICKNSWGPDWGENGFFRIKYGQCEIDDSCVWISVEPARYPKLQISGVTLHETVGDGDGIANPGEQALLEFWVVTSPYWGVADGLTLELIPSQNISILQGTQLIDEVIFPGDSIFCSGVLEIQTDAAGPVADLPLQLTLGSNLGDEYEYGITATILVRPSLTMPGWPIVPNEEFAAAQACFRVGTSVLIAAADKAGNLYLFDSEGEILPGWPVSLGGSIRSAPAIADLDGDGRPEIVVGSSSDVLAAYDLDGEQMFSKDVGRTISATVMLADIGGDTLPEIIVGDLAGNLWALDQQGNSLPGWPVDLGSPIISSALLVPSGRMHFVCCGTMSGSLHLLDSTGNELPGWPLEFGSDIWTGPVAASPGGDGEVEIFCAAEKEIYRIMLDGSFTELFSGSVLIRSALLCLDMDGDSELEAVFATSDLNIHVVDQSGAYLPGWPKNFQGSTFSGLAAADLDGEGSPELVYTTDQGMLYFLDAGGNLVSPSPVYLDYGILSPPSLFDLDDDGDLEILIGTDNGIIAIDQKDEGATTLWATHRVEITRSGYSGIITASSPLADTPSSVSMLRLLSCDPVPSTDRIFLTFIAPTDQLLSIELYDMSGRLCLSKRILPEPGIMTQSIALSSLPAGAYVVSISSGTLSESNTILHLR